jgi:hypothetical protein
MRTTCLAHVILFDMITQIIFGEEYTSEIMQVHLLLLCYHLIHHLINDSLHLF